MMSRYHLRCPGCEEVFVARIGAQPTDLTKFYFLCPHCQLPIRGRMTGQELTEHRVTFDGEIVDSSLAPDDARVITIDPFVPSRYDADSFDGVGTFPTMTLMRVLRERFTDWMSDNGQATAVVDELWTPTEMLFEYYLDSNWAMVEKIAKSKLGMDEVGPARHQRSTLAYQALGTVTIGVVGSTGGRGAKLFDRYSRKHLASIRREPYRALLRERDEASRSLERDIFVAIGHFIDNYPSWSIGRLPRFLEEGALEGLTLFRDEFAMVRDLYQQGFELACKCLWLLVAAQNTVKRADPHAFGEHPAIVPVKTRPKNLGQFDKLSNAYKIAYVAQVPGWDGLDSLLDNQRRNTIGHASARHDLRSARVVSDKDLTGITYIEFLSEVLDVFETLSSLMQSLRLVRVAASPDFAMNSSSAPG